ncbi:hypothetical protein VT98_14601 [Candidatus Electrothrix communis]|uniref:Uncharacterized protein n=1 Tax=Candidatus Electrothrix communis TaxID=1859133 RepID=A0A444IQI3_9BACT|nr:hypothetical protein VT98_14601 [Candidatus Electrothrix communis]
MLHGYLSLSSEQGDLSEFERSDVSSVMQLLESLEEEISNMNFATVASTAK